jgi:hypothetical protein
MGGLSKLDLAWAGGILDGEGYIGAYAMGNFTRLKIAVNNTDPRMLLKLYNMFGGRLYAYPKRKERQVYSWSTQDSHATKVIAQVLPYLVVKKEQAAIALRFSDTYVKNGQKVSEENKGNRKKWARKLKQLKGPNLYSHIWDTRETPNI